MDLDYEKEETFFLYSKILITTAEPLESLRFSRPTVMPGISLKYSVSTVEAT